MRKIETNSNGILVTTLTEEVYKRLRTQIMKGDFSPGDKLSIRELSKDYEVSTMPVREAMNRLQSEGFVSFRRRSIYVKQLSCKEVVEIFKIRKHLEKMAIEWSYDQIGPDECEELEKMVKEIDGYLDDSFKWNFFNKEFHFKLYSYSDSKPLLELLQQVWGRVEPYMHIYSSSQEYMLISQHEHYQILDYLRMKNVQKLIDLTMDHIQKTCDVILSEMKAKHIGEEGGR